VWLSRQRQIGALYKRFVIVEGDVGRTNGPRELREPATCGSLGGQGRWLRDCLRRDDVDFLAARTGTTLLNSRWEERLVDVNRLGERIVSPLNVRMFIDGDQGHGWNETAVHRELEVIRNLFEAQPHRDYVASFDSTRARGPLQ
jgi:hypothetical protein